MLTLEVGRAQFPVQRLPLLQSCNSVALHCKHDFYHCKCSPSLDIFHDFLSAIDGQNINITTENFLILSELSTEFGFDSLLMKLRKFSKSNEWKLHELSITVKEQSERISKLESAIARDREDFNFRLSQIENLLKKESRSRCGNEVLFGITDFFYGE
jgi:hypothetical protein